MTLPSVLGRACVGSARFLAVAGLALALTATPASATSVHDPDPGVNDANNDSSPHGEVFQAELVVVVTVEETAPPTGPAAATPEQADDQLSGVPSPGAFDADAA